MSTIPTDRQRMLHIELDLPVAIQDEFCLAQQERLSAGLRTQTLPEYLVTILAQAASDSHERRRQRVIQYRWSAYSDERRYR